MNHNPARSYPSPASTSLRKSCDHCHANKLRCSPGISLRSTCRRCQQAGHPCNYSARSARQTTAREARPSNSPKLSRVMPVTEQATFPVMESGMNLFSPFGSEDSSLSVGNVSWWLGETAHSQIEDLEPIDSNFNRSLSQNAQTDISICGSLLGTERENPAIGFAGIEQISGPQKQSDDLSSISQALEGMLQCVAVEWPGKDIQYYPIGELFDAFGRLTVILATLPIGTTVMDECLRTKNTFVAAHTYIICVKIMGSLAKTLQRYIEEAQRHVDTTSSLHSVVSYQLSENPMEDPKLKIDDLFSRVNPYVHALASCCATLRVGLQHLRRIEVALNIPREQGVTGVSGLLSLFPNSSEVTEGGPLCAAYLLTAFWSNEKNAVDSTGATTLDEYLQCCVYMFDLGREYRL